MSRYIEQVRSAAADYKDRAGGSVEVKALALIGLHIPLALLIREFPALGLVHALTVLVVGLVCAVRKKRPELAAYVAAYITGAEVLWRMTQTSVFWEFGKYAVATILFVSMFVSRRRKASILPLLYFITLLPSLLKTTDSMDWDTARKQISFYLSGPFALMICSLFFSQINLSKRHVLNIFLAVICPVTGVASIAILSTVTAQNLEFTTGSNFVTSGGFGPNQVSAALGLGALTSMLYVLDERVSLRMRVLLLILAIILLIQSVLTFSRSGLYDVILSLLVAALFYVRNNRTRVKFILIAGLLSSFSFYVVLPRLDDFTEGFFKMRFESIKTSGREDFALAELRAWEDNFILGAGPGGAESYRHEEIARTNDLLVASHTEYTRLLAEHGLLGLYAILLLLSMALRNVTRAGAGESGARVAAFTVWAALFMSGNAMRMVAPSFVFGLGFATFLSSEASQASFNSLRQNIALKRSHLLAEQLTTRLPHDPERA